jgi:hypothetical protein
VICISQDHLRTGTCDLDHPILVGVENADRTRGALDVGDSKVKEQKQRSSKTKVKSSKSIRRGRLEQVESVKIYRTIEPLL